MKRVTSIVVVILALGGSVFADTGEKEKERITDAANAAKDIFDAPDKGVPLSVLQGTKCVVVIPDLKKAAFIIGGDYGRGVMTCRTGADFKGPCDVVILVLNDDGARSLMKSKIKLGAEASVAAGPVGRTAEASTNARMHAQMLSYSRSRGVFAGVSVSGMTLRVDGDANENLYGEKVTGEQILKGQVQMPEQGKALVEALKQATEKASASER